MAESLQQQAYDCIKDKIISLAFGPNTIISEASLLKELDMSRTPVREALIKLEHEGFVRILAKRGILINPISLTDVTMIFDSRIVLEPALLSRYPQYIDKTRLRELRLMMEDIDTAEDFYALDKELHPVLCLSGPNHLLTSSLRHVLDQHNRIRRLCAPTRGSASSRRTRSIWHCPTASSQATSGQRSGFSRSICRTRSWMPLPLS